YYRVNGRLTAQSEDQVRIYGALKPSRCPGLHGLRAIAGIYRYLSSQCIPVSIGAAEFYFEILVGRQVFIDEGLHVDIVDHEVVVTVVIKIAISRSVTEAFLCQADGRCDVFELKIAAVEEGEMSLRSVREIFDKVTNVGPSGFFHHFADFLLAGDEVDKVEIGEIVRDAVAGNNLSLPVIVHIGEHRTPAPGDRRLAGEARRLAKGAIDLVDL